MGRHALSCSDQDGFLCSAERAAAEASHNFLTAAAPVRNTTPSFSLRRRSLCWLLSAAYPARYPQAESTPPVRCLIDGNTRRVHRTPADGRFNYSQNELIFNGVDWLLRKMYCELRAAAECAAATVLFVDHRALLTARQNWGERPDGHQ